MNMLASLVLVFGSMAMTFGLGAVAASLAPSTRVLEETAGGRMGMGKSGGSTAVTLAESGHVPAELPAAPMDLIARSAPTSLSRAGATGPWKSPLYPQNGVTLWDRVRVSTQRDRRAFLLGTAIQVHTPAIAATPGPCCLAPSEG